MIIGFLLHRRIMVARGAIFIVFTLHLSRIIGLIMACMRFAVEPHLSHGSTIQRMVIARVEGIIYQQGRLNLLSA